MDEESSDPWMMSHPTLHGVPLQHRRSQRLLACQACISLLLTQALPAVCSCHTSYHGFCLPHDIHSSKPATLAFAPLTQTDRLLPGGPSMLSSMDTSPGQESVPASGQLHPERKEKASRHA